ncbi:MAG: hypothetical protein QXQ94_09130 [Candidatus Bathyarchaeia archaeon]
METQKIDVTQKALSSFGEAFLQRKGSVPMAGFEPAKSSLFVEKKCLKLGFGGF